MTYTLPDLPYDYSALEPAISGAIVELHHDKHHKLYVDNANATLDKLAAARESGDFGAIVGLEKTLAFNVSGHVLHTIYWENLSPQGGGEPTGALAEQITKDFGSFAAFKGHLGAAASTVQGSGWGLLTWDPLGSRLQVEQIQDHQSSTVINSTTILALDAWEHAWYLQYKNVKADYFTALWTIINWADVSTKFEAATHSH
jgi:Fe-Mn family superoxide dismutase